MICAKPERSILEVSRDDTLPASEWPNRGISPVAHSLPSAANCAIIAVCSTFDRTATGPRSETYERPARPKDPSDWRARRRFNITSPRSHRRRQSSNRRSLGDDTISALGLVRRAVILRNLSSQDSRKRFFVDPLPNVSVSDPEIHSLSIPLHHPTEQHSC